MPSHHQVGALDRLGAIWGAQVACVWGEDVSEERRSQGWPALPRPNVRDIYLPPIGWQTAVEEIVVKHKDAFHIFSGIGAYPQLTHALHVVERLPSPRYAVMAETPVLLGWQAWLRRGKSAWNYRPRRKKMLGLLAMGEMAVRYYAGFGVSRDRIYPYAYQSSGDGSLQIMPKDGSRFVYFGQLDRRKGVDLLISASARIRGSFSLDIIGDGAERSSLESLVRQSALLNKVNFLGTLPSAELQARLPEYAFAVVPSRFDGWGMAVNESLQAGIPVLASDRVGAAELVRYSGAGAVYPADSVAALVEQISKRVGNQDLLTAEREAARKYKDRLRPDVIGDYLKEALEHMLGARQTKPTPPWVV